MEEEEQEESGLVKVLSKLKKEHRDNDSLKKENAKLKKELNKLRNSKGTILENKKLKEENKKLKEAIAEIKEELKEMRSGYLSKEKNLDKINSIDEIANKLENMEQKLVQISSKYNALDEIDKVQLENKVDQLKEISLKSEEINKIQNTKDEKNNEKEIKETLYELEECKGELTKNKQLNTAPDKQEYFKKKIDELENKLSQFLREKEQSSGLKEDMQKQVDMTAEKGEVVNNINTNSEINLAKKNKPGREGIDKPNSKKGKVVNIKDKENIKKELQKLESKDKGSKENKNKDRSVSR
jgi:hypothetical protein